MRRNLLNKKDDNGFIGVDKQERLEKPLPNDRLPEFDEYGTALNEI